GTLFLNVGNVFTGGVKVLGGTVTIPSVSGVPSSLGATSGTITLDGGALVQTNPGNAGSYVQSTWTINVGPGGGTVNYASSGTGGTIKTGGANLTIASKISGGGSLTYIGSICTTIGTNTYTGGTWINTGRVNFNQNSSAGTGSINAINTGAGTVTIAESSGSA